MHYEKCLNLFVLTIKSVLFIANSTFKQKLTQSAFKTDTFTLQVSKNPSCTRKAKMCPTHAKYLL